MLSHPLWLTPSNSLRSQEQVGVCQGAPKGGRQKEFDHFCFRFRDSFLSFFLLSLFLGWIWFLVPQSIANPYPGSPLPWGFLSWPTSQMEVLYLGGTKIAPHKPQRPRLPQAGLQPFRSWNRRVFCLAGCKKSLAAGVFVDLPQNRRKLATTVVASRCSSAILQPQRPRDTKFWILGKPFTNHSLTKESSVSLD